MKNIKKILFSFILVCTFFCFSKNVLADTTCNYVADYPFDDSIIVSNPKIIYSQYIKYVYICGDIQTKSVLVSLMVFNQALNLLMQHIILIAIK